ncbi:hypothetical protein [Desulfurispira natronophila]|uniref:Uncharacterized protein n=1 Tax=Desulfurispira natronophila TaxID=682562 RepID=A0A7W7Y5C2_9BACT|nr:hypothetical protein [Desulfurispira natronophila]MBB5022386.1 hypothetical protein [Desulfurispira natronophila]
MKNVSHVSITNHNQKAPFISREMVPMWDIRSLSPTLRRRVRNHQVRIVTGTARDFSSGKVLQKLSPVYIPPKQAWELAQQYEATKTFRSRPSHIRDLILVAMTGASILHSKYLEDTIPALAVHGDILRMQLPSVEVEQFCRDLETYGEHLLQLRYHLSESALGVLYCHLESRELRARLFDNLSELTEELKLSSNQLRRSLLAMITAFLDFAPKGIFLETQAAYRCSSLTAGDRVQGEGAQQYFEALRQLRQWSEGHHEYTSQGVKHSLSRTLDAPLNSLLLTISI